MTLEEIIKYCENVADYDCFSDAQRKCSEEHRRIAGWLPRCCFEQLREAVDKAIKALEEPKWIPCSERLPETEEQVLIYAWNVHYVLAKYKEIRTCDGVYKMAWVTEDAYSIPREIKHEVIYWKPLPEPYREE